MNYEASSVINTKSKTRIKCPNCNAFICEVKPVLLKGQVIVAKCKRCHTEFEAKQQ